MKKGFLFLFLSIILLTSFPVQGLKSQPLDWGWRSDIVVSIGIDPPTALVISGAILGIEYVLRNREWTKTIPPTVCDSNAPNSECERWTQWVEQTAVVDGNILGYEDCKFIVSYASRVCITNRNIMQINILSWSAKWTLLGKWFGNDCEGFKKDVESLPPFAKAKAYLEIQKALYDRISRELFIKSNQENYGQSGEYIDCNDVDYGGGKIKIMYSLGSCNSIFSVKVKTKENNEEIWRYTLPCTENTCCMFTNIYCWDNQKKEVVSTTLFDGPTQQTCNGTIQGGKIEAIIDLIEKNGGLIIDVNETACVPSCSEYIPENN